MNTVQSTGKGRIIAAIAMVVGVATLFSGGAVLFGPQSGREALGVVLQPVLVFNFMMGALYIWVGLGIWRSRRWAEPSAWGIFAVNTAACLGVYGYWMMGNAVAPRTLGATVFRAALWLLLAGYLTFSRRAQKS